MNDLLVLADIKAIDVFKPNGAEDILVKIRNEATTIIFDISTDAGRKECASMAYKIARSKTTLDDLGKSLVADKKAEIALVDAERKRIRDQLDLLKDEVRKPLTDFENIEKIRVFQHEQYLEMMNKLGQYYPNHAKNNADALIILKDQLSKLLELYNRDWQEYSGRADQTYNQNLEILNRTIQMTENSIIIEKQMAEAAIEPIANIKPRVPAYATLTVQPLTPGFGTRLLSQAEILRYKTMQKIHDYMLGMQIDELQLLLKAIEHRVKTKENK